MNGRPQQNADFSSWLKGVETRRPTQRYFEVPHNILELPCNCRRKRVLIKDDWGRPRTRISEGFSIIKVRSLAGIYWQHLACEKAVSEPVKPAEVVPAVLPSADLSYPRNGFVGNL